MCDYDDNAKDNEHPDPPVENSAGGRVSGRRRRYRMYGRWSTEYFYIVATFGACRAAASRAIVDRFLALAEACAVELTAGAF